MALEQYRSKRNLKRTPEPAGGKSAGAGLHFVVQKHDASHLHYDFRLELRGVLKSWAVPKGPSLDPEVKRLAMLVEDHPYDYKDFEGIIPEGNYGAGTVIIWDEGMYEPIEKGLDKKEQEKLLTKQFYAGKIEIVLHGHKLKGKFNLVKAAGRGDNGWLLIKAKDAQARVRDVLLKDKSVVSGHTIETMAGSADAREWKSNRSSAKKTASGAKARGLKAPIPKTVQPMLCTLTKAPVQDEAYLYEIKWDGYRIISYIKGRTVKLASRGNKDYTAKYPPIVEALAQLGHDAVLDGEVVVFNEEGKPDFGAVQRYNGHDSPISYCVFDILWLDGYSLKELPLNERKAILKDLVADSSVLQYSEDFDDGVALYEQAMKMELEGIVAKRRQSSYRENERGYDWLKVPTKKRQEFVIGGWADSEKARSFRSLLFGAYHNGRLQWIGRSGGGYKEKEMPAILRQLQKLEIKSSPFVNKVLDTKGATIHWVKPQLVANFEFSTWTDSGRIRKPATFLGFRKDKQAKDVVREVPVPVEEVKETIEEETQVPGPPAKRASSAKGSASKDSNWRELEKIVPHAKENFTIGGCDIMLSDVDRKLWEGVNKAKLIDYYHQISGLLLDYLEDRPLSLHVKPYGPTAPGFYIKDMEGRRPECADIFTDRRRHPKPGKRSKIDYLVCNNEATLLYLVNLGCIDMNPWMSRTAAPEQPDFINIDLDPTDDDFGKVIEACQAAMQVLDEHGLKYFIKTSGKTGMHLYLPVEGIGFEQVRNVSERLGEEIHRLVPDITTTEVSISRRGKKVFIDPSQNDYADTLAAPYTVRPYRLPTVSTPLSFREIKRGLDPSDFTIDTVLKRIRKKGDLFAGALKKLNRRKNAGILKKM